MARDTVETHFTDAVATLKAGAPRDPALPIKEGSTLTGERCRELYDRQQGSRLLDIAARWLREQNEGFYTIGSAGHEGNAAVAAAVRTTDPALLHYRSGAFYLTRSVMAGRLPEQGLRDVLLGLTASSDEPIAGGRHKVFGHPDLAIIPQTSTIASHLPRSVGVALAIERARALGVASAWPGDAIAVCSFGDASINHASALSAFNTASYATYQGQPLPILFVCEDNGLGISVRTPKGWVEAAARRPGIEYIQADGCDLAEVHDAAVRAAEHVRTTRSPAFLHLSTVRLMGHAGSDVESSYRTQREIRADYERDPLLRTAALLVEAGLATPEELLRRYEAEREHLLRMALEATRAPKLTSAREIIEPLAPRRADMIAKISPVAAEPSARRRPSRGSCPRRRTSRSRSPRRSTARWPTRWPSTRR
ncbi:thiamine pyrophosphate-dependent enzyme [Nonomuraea recticatena]|uniref:thiamine pyrophosphate-dependent enzyme n=1 Tax=Nonomuraea recticatena TaxID=46178 RepID=UPI00360F3E6D